MLIHFKVRNYRSFADEQTLDLVASNDSRHSDNLVKAGKFSLLKSAAIYGANASGKSNLIRAMALMDRFIEGSATQSNVGDPIAGVVPFRLDTKRASEPSSFEISLTIEDVRYVYGFSLSSTRVFDEWLYVTLPGGRMTNWLTRHYDRARKRTEWMIRGPLRKHHELLSQRTRDNGLVLSRAAELNIEEVQDLYLWFKNNLTVIDLSHDPHLLGQQTARRAATDPGMKARILRLLKDADLGVDEFTIRSREYVISAELSKDAPNEALEIMKGLQSAQQFARRLAPQMIPDSFYEVSTLHRSNRQGEAPIAFNLDADESNGTRRFFALAGPILDALDRGAALVLDEFECSIHPLLARKMLELFQGTNVNRKGAQLIFATHDSSLMSLDLFRRDQIWLTSKNSKGATELFSLYNIGKDRPRNTEAIQKNYLDARYGAVPQFGPVFEDLEFS
jgi:AAA15 family ATPase/GTPase